MAFEEKKMEKPKEVKKGKRLTRDQFLIAISLISTIATVAVFFMIVKKNAPPQVVVGEIEQKAKVMIKKVDWRKSLIDTELFQQLKNPLPAPVDVGTMGNPKPFSE